MLTSRAFLPSKRSTDFPIPRKLLSSRSKKTNRTARSGFSGLLGPILDALDRGDLLVVDELDCSMHPHLTYKLVEMFQSAEANPKGAQLVFATHDTNLMTPALFRRDEIWLTEKAADGGTELFSLADIKSETPRKDDAFEKHYLAGRYGGVPSFGPALEDIRQRHDATTFDRRRSGSSRPQRPSRSEKTTVLIVCEGRETETNYFDQLKQEECVKRVLAITVKRGKGGSRQQVAQFAVERKDTCERRLRRSVVRHGCRAVPTAWTTMREALDIVGAQCNTPGLSNPAFEVWLLGPF